MGYSSTTFCLLCEKGPARSLTELIVLGDASSCMSRNLAGLIFDPVFILAMLLINNNPIQKTKEQTRLMFSNILKVY